MSVARRRGAAARRRAARVLRAGRPQAAREVVAPAPAPAGTVEEVAGDGALPDPEPQPEAGAWGARLSALAGPAHVASLLAAAPALVWFNRDQWFFGDEWAYFAGRMTGWGRVLFEPHNEHWTTVPVLVFRALYRAVGVRSYLPYAVVLVAVHLLATHLLWRVMKRVGVAPLVATALAAVFAVLGAGGENLLWAFQIAMVGSVAAGLGHLLLADHPGPFGRRDRIGWVVAVVGLACSGIGVTMTAVTGLAVLVRHDARRALATVGPPAAVYVLWLATVGHETLGKGEGSDSDVFDAPAYLWKGLTSALEGASGIPGAGAALVVVTVGWLLRQRAVAGTPRAAATAMAVGAAALFVVLATGRSGLGVAQATSLRYVYIAVALLLPALGLMLSEGTRGVAARQLAVVGLLVPVLVHNLGELRDLSRTEAEREDAIRGQVLGAALLVDRGAELAATQPEPVFSPNVTVELVERLRREGALPAPRSVDEVDLLTVATYLQVGTSPEPPAAAPAGAPPPSVAVPVDGRGCLLAGPVGAPPVEVTMASGQAVSLLLVAGGPVDVTMRDSADPDVVGRPRRVALRPGAAEWFRVTRDATLGFSVPGGAAAELCGVLPR